MKTSGSQLPEIMAHEQTLVRIKMRRIILILVKFIMILTGQELIAQTATENFNGAAQSDKKDLEQQELQWIMKQDSLNGFYIPKNIDECMTELDTLLKKEEKKKFMSSIPMKYHKSLGLYLRNNWGLWQGSRLQKYFTNLGTTHPDDMSSIILNCYWRYLKGDSTDFDTELNRHPRIVTPQLLIPDSMK